MRLGPFRWESSDASPRRRVWRRLVLGLLGVALFFCLFAIAWWWQADMKAEQELAAVHDALRAAGLPATREEFLASNQPIPEEQNLGQRILAAAALIDIDSPAWNALLDDYGRSWLDPLLPEDEAERTRLWRRLVAEQAPALAAARIDDLLARPPGVAVHADFGVWSGEQARSAPMLMEVIVSHLNPVRQLARPLQIEARLAVVEGRPDEALETILLLIGIADAVDAAAYSRVEHRAATDIRSLASDAALELAQDGLPHPIEPHMRRRLERVIGHLLEDAACRDAHRRSIAGEMAMHLDTFAALIDGRATEEGVAFGQSDGAGSSPVDRFERLLARPLVRGEAAKLATVMLAHYHAAGAAAWPEAQLDPQTAALEAAIEEKPGVLAFAFLPSPHAMRAQYRMLADRRLAATALAMAAYRAEHDGSLPGSLSVLVAGGYLPHVPRDPMAVDAPIRYDRSRGLLWSVGDNGIDDDGGVTPKARARLPFYEWDLEDRVVPLTREAQLGIWSQWAQWEPRRPTPEQERVLGVLRQLTTP